MIKFFSMILIAVSFQYFAAHPAYPAEDTWGIMMDGIKRYSSDMKLREQFEDQCRHRETAKINGRLDTGGGLYMIMDVPAYLVPGQSKRTELPHETTVILTGGSQELEGKVWKEIEFLFVSAYSKTAISIDKAWVEEVYIKDGS